MSTSFGMWKETSISLIAGLNVVNLDSSTNILKIINEDMLGSVLYLSTKSDVSQNKFEEKVETGSSTSLVRTRALGTAFVFNPSPSPVNVTMIEIQTDDISFIFNASNQVNIGGTITSDGLKNTDLKQLPDRTLYVLDSVSHAKLDSLIALMTTNNSLTTDTNTKLDALIAKP